MELPFEEVKEQVSGNWTNFVLSKFHVDEDYVFQDLLQHERIEVARRNRVFSSSSGTTKPKIENAGVSRKTVVKTKHRREMVTDYQRETKMHRCCVSSAISTGITQVTAQTS